jgi:hypothetical protein
VSVSQPRGIGARDLCALPSTRSPAPVAAENLISGGSWLREVANARLHTATSIRHVRRDSLVSRRLQILESNAVSDARIGGVAIYRELFGAGLAGQKVALALSQVIAERGAPVSITVDNGIEFASKAMEAWAARRRY